MAYTQRLREQHAVLYRPTFSLLAVLSLMNFCHWKWSCKTRRWVPRPGRTCTFTFTSCFYRATSW